MVGFRNNVEREPVVNWWDNDNNIVAFCRGNKGFVAFNNEQNEAVVTINTCLPRGDYCDVISGKKVERNCSGKKITVNEKGKSVIRLKAQSVVAIHSGVSPTVRYRSRVQFIIPFCCRRNYRFNLLVQNIMKQSSKTTTTKMLTIYFRNNGSLVYLVILFLKQIKPTICAVHRTEHVAENDVRQTLVPGK